MIGRLAFYAIEAALLAGVAAASLVLAMQGLRRLGAPVRVGFLRLLWVLWLVFVIVGSVFGERVGPEFVMPYQFCFWLAIGSASLWLVSFAGRGSLAPGLRAELKNGNGRRSE